MDFAYTESELAFQKELRAWLEENLPEGWLEGKRVIPEDDNQKRRF